MVDHSSHRRPASPITYGGSSDLPASADFDGDGKPEFATYRQSTNQWFIAGQAQPISYGGPNDLPVPADYNGDGKAELAIYRPYTNEWFIYGQAQPIVYGGPNDRPAAGDGKADIATYRPSTGEWFIAGVAQPILIGGANDLPASGNYYGFGQAASRSFVSFDAAGRVATKTDPLGRGDRIGGQAPQTRCTRGSERPDVISWELLMAGSRRSWKSPTRRHPAIRARLAKLRWGIS